jgi:hypothetical protein
MVGFLRLNQYNRMVLSSLLLTFPLAVLTPPLAHAQINISINDINFGIVMQKLIDKTWKYYNKKDSDGLVDVLLDIKGQVESYRGIKINLEKEVDKAQAELKKKGHKAPKEAFKKYKNLLKKKEKKNHHRAVCMEAYFLDTPNMNFDQYEMLHLAAAAKHANKNEEEGPKDSLPFQFMLGVSLMLCGAFVMFATPVCPIFGPAGESLMLTGFGFLIEQGVEIYQKEY